MRGNVSEPVIAVRDACDAHSFESFTLQSHWQAVGVYVTLQHLSTPSTWRVHRMTEYMSPIILRGPLQPASAVGWIVAAGVPASMLEALFCTSLTSLLRQSVTTYTFDQYL